MVGFELVHQADAAAFLRKIEKNAGARFADFFKREFELGAAVAAFGGQNVAGEALRVDANEGRGAAAVDFAVDHGDGGFGGGASFEAEDFEVAELRREFGAGDDAHFRGWISFGHLEFSIIAGWVTALPSRNVRQEARRRRGDAASCCPLLEIGRRCAVNGTRGGASLYFVRDIGRQCGCDAYSSRFDRRFR